MPQTGSFTESATSPPFTSPRPRRMGRAHSHGDASFGSKRALARGSIRSDSTVKSGFGDGTERGRASWGSGAEFAFAMSVPGEVQRRCQRRAAPPWSSSASPTGSRTPPRPLWLRSARRTSRSSWSPATTRSPRRRLPLTWASSGARRRCFPTTRPTSSTGSASKDASSRSPAMVSTTPPRSRPPMWAWPWSSRLGTTPRASRSPRAFFSPRSGGCSRPWSRSA
jgi:hypothetical protein